MRMMRCYSVCFLSCGATSQHIPEHSGATNFDHEHTFLLSLSTGGKRDHKGHDWYQDVAHGPHHPFLFHTWIHFHLKSSQCWTRCWTLIARFSASGWFRLSLG
uniref:Putative secreted protein n=1 Tax=Anopheles marajoara TaxID=58244 RepID=A0A2M4C8K4_9DIPT